MQKWEYLERSRYFHLSEDKINLNRLGAEGWELVCVLDEGKEAPDLRQNWTLIFRRPVSE